MSRDGDGHIIEATLKEVSHGLSHCPEMPDSTGDSTGDRTGNY